MVTDELLSTSPASPPRELTGRVRTRSWGDPFVRFWSVSGLLILIAGIYLTATQFLEWRHGAWLVRSGTPVWAKVMEADGDPFGADGKSPGRPKPSTVVVRLKFPWKDSSHTVEGHLAGRKSSERITTGDSVDIRINPDDADDWTDRKEPAPLGIQILGGMIAIAFSAVLIVASWLARRRVLRTWRDGSALEAIIVGRQHTALAPRCHALRCTPADGNDKRVFTVYVPQHATTGESGQSIWVIRPPGPGRTLPAALFE